MSEDLTEQEIDSVDASKMSKREREEHRRIMRLFQNRVELKQEFIRLRDDRNSLLEKIKKAERETELVVEEKSELEKLLASPETGANVIVYYQLRNLWAECNQQLVKLAEVLKKQQVDRERKREIMEFNRDREKRLAHANDLVVSAKSESDQLQLELNARKKQLDDKAGVWHYFERRKMRKDLDPGKDQLAQIRIKIEELFSRRIKIESEQWPEFKGISLKGKRAINIALLALTQHLYIHFSSKNFSEMSKLAMRQRPSEVHYGLRQDCEYLMQKISEAVERLGAQQNMAEMLRARSDMLRDLVEFKNENDPVPLASSVSKISTTVGKDLSESGVLMDVNVLAEDFWNVLDVMVD